MNDLKTFFNDFCSHFEDFPFTFEFKDEHTLRLYFGTNVSSVFLSYIVYHCPDSCSYFVSGREDTNIYICVYDD
jgi:hypothetical protein